MKKIIDHTELDTSSVFRTILTMAVTFLTYVVFTNVIATAIVFVVSLLFINILGINRPTRYVPHILAIIIMLIVAFNTGAFNNLKKADHVCEPEVITVNTCKCTCEGCQNGEECTCMKDDKPDETNKDGEGEENAKVTQNKTGYVKPKNPKPTTEEKIQATHKSDEGNNGNGTETKVEGAGNTDFGETGNNQNEKVKEDLKNDGNVPTEGKEGITAWTKPDTEPEAPVVTPKPEVKIDLTDAVDISKDAENTKVDKTENGNKTDNSVNNNSTSHKGEKPSVMTDEDIKNNSTDGNSQLPQNNSGTNEQDKVVDNTDKGNGAQTPETKPVEKPATQTKPEESAPTQKVEKPVEETKPIEDSKPVETTKPVTKTEPVSIRPLDGNTAFAGDTVQFQVKGDVKAVEGMDGMKYNLDNGYLSVQTNANEATVVSPTIVGLDGSTSSATVTVNALPGSN